MRSVPVSDFIPTLRQLVNVPLPGLMETAIVKAAQTFCRKSKLVTFYRGIDEVMARQTMTIVANSAMNRRASNSYKSADIQLVKTNDEPLILDTDYHILSRDEVYFLKDQTNVVVVCAVEPVQNATQLPSVLFDDYLDGICSGAASQLLVQPDADWADGNLAAYHDRQFVEACREASRFRLDASPDLAFSNPTRKREFF